jgi:hypothetical protein
MWHWRVWIRIVLIARKEQLLARLGWHSGRSGGRAREFNLPPRVWHVQSIGAAPFEAVSYQSGRVSWAQADLYSHMSNSVYPALMDSARFAWATKFIGPALIHERLMLPLAGVSTVFFKEIPIFKDYLIETRTAGYTDRWVRSRSCHGRPG